MARPSVVARLTLVLVLVLLTIAPVAAQTAEGDSVRSRARPEFAPLGLELDQHIANVIEALRPIAPQLGLRG